MNWPKINRVISIPVYCNAEGGSQWLIPTVTNIKSVVSGARGCKDMLLLAKVMLHSNKSNEKYMNWYKKCSAKQREKGGEKKIIIIKNAL